ncbi:MAG: nucleoside 2-deoxyribosyltransferase [Candidatus Pacebacteria bacterium]|nr:nucleoside 2-deoxyribosyltransferase [Candidatus Paceibacterota bacterium]
MKIYISHPNSIDFKTILYEPLKASELSQKHEFFLPHDEGRDENTKEVIRTSGLLIAEVSEPSTGSGIEMGWASAFEVPVWCVYQKDMKPSGSAKYIASKMFAYTDSKDLTSILNKELETVD